MIFCTDSRGDKEATNDFLAIDYIGHGLIRVIVRCNECPSSCYSDTVK